MPTLAYRLRILDAPETGTILAVTSVAGGTAPWIVDPPSGDGLEFDPLRGTVRTGAYNVRVADPITSGTSRLVTSVLADAGFRNQLLSRRAFVEQSTNGGASWDVLLAGYVLGVRLVDAITYEIGVGDSRRVERTRSIFDRDDPAYFPIRGAWFGGPVIGGQLPAMPFRRGGLFVVQEVSGSRVQLDFVTGFTPDDKQTGNFREFVGSRGVASYAINAADEWADAYYTIDENRADRYRFPGLRYRVSAFLTGAPVGSFVPTVPPQQLLRGGGGKLTGTGGKANDRHIAMDWTGSTPSVGSLFWVALLTDLVSEECPLFTDDHPAVIARKLYQQAGIPIDAGSFDAVAAELGADVRLTLRITEPTTLLSFVENVICGPFGIGLRVNGAGQVEAFSARILSTTLPSVTIGTNDLADAEAPIFELDESTVVNAVRYESLNLVPRAIGQTAVRSESDPPRDGLFVSEAVNVFARADVSTFGTREVSFKVPGMVRTVSTFSDQTPYALGAYAAQLLDRYARGMQAATVRVLRGTVADGVRVGDEVYLAPAHLPNRNKRLGDDPSVGARIVQVVRRTDSPDAIELHVLDSGVGAQPGTAPTITVAGVSSTVASFTITNAAALNAIESYQPLVEWAIGPTTPTSGTPYGVSNAPNIPTGAVRLPAVPPGSTVWVRVRGEVPGLRPTAWSAWTSVTLAVIAAPTGLGATDIRIRGARLSWTNTLSTLRVRVWAAPTAASDPTSDQWIVADLLPGSTTTRLTSLLGPSIPYTATVAYVTDDGFVGLSTSVAFTTNTTEDPALRPAGIAVVSPPAGGPSESSEYRTGVAVAVWPADPGYLLVLERAPDVAGAPGTFAEVVVVPGSTEVYLDELPSTGATFWYRWRHRFPSWGDSSPTCARAGVVSGVPDGIARPPLVVPVVVATLSEVGTTGTVTLAITDPQCRVVQVRSRVRTDGINWSAWTVLPGPTYVISGTIPPTGFLEIQYEVSGYDGTGALVTFASAIEYFDVGTAPNITNISGTFSTLASFYLSVNADSDSQSIKYAISTSAYPSLATVQAQTPLNTRNADIFFGGPYTVNQIVYVSALAYSGLNGTGAESTLAQARFIRDGIDLRIEEELSETATLGTAVLRIADPNARVSAVEARTKVGRNAWSAYTASTNTGTATARVHTITVALVEKAPSLIEYRVLGTTVNQGFGQVLVSNTITFAMGTKPFIPDLFATVRENGLVDVVLQGDSDTASTRIGFSIVSQAAADSAAAVASPVNGRTRTALSVGALSLGEKGWVSAYAYSGTGGTGEVSNVAQVEIIRGNVNTAKTIRFAGSSAWNPAAPALTFYERTAEFYRFLGGSNSFTLFYHFAKIPVPQGATITAIRINCGYFLLGGSRGLNFRFFRITSGGTKVQVGATVSLDTVTGPLIQTVTIGSLSELASSGRSYVLEAQTFATDLDTTFVCYELETDYTSPDLTVTL